MFWNSIYGFLMKKIGDLCFFFSSPEHKLRVSYCHHPMSVVRHSSSTISLLTLKRSQFWPNLDETWSECLPLWNLGQVRYWVTWVEKLGHQVKSKEKLVNTLEVIVDETCSKCLLLLNLGKVRNRVTWGQKLGHRARSAENLVNTLAGTFLKQSSWILPIDDF